MYQYNINTLGKLSSLNSKTRRLVKIESEDYEGLSLYGIDDIAKVRPWRLIDSRLHLLIHMLPISQLQKSNTW